MGVYRLALTPAISFEVIWTLGPNFGSKAPLALNLKIAIFSQKPYNMGVYRLAWTPVIIFEVIWILGLNSGSKGLWPQTQKSALLLQNPTIWVSTDLTRPQQSVLR